MPQNPVLVYEKEGGTPTYMHSVDAAEAVRLGDYTAAPPGGEQPDPEARASAMSRFHTGQGVTHPELQTEEEKQRTRDAANEQAALLEGVPPGTPIVVQAPSVEARQSAARSAAQRTPAPTAQSAPPETRSASTPETPPGRSGGRPSSSSS